MGSGADPTGVAGLALAPGAVPLSAKKRSVERRLWPTRPPSRSKCIIVYNDRKVRERLFDGCGKVTSAQWLDLNLHVEKTITLNGAFPVEHRVNTLCSTLANPVVRASASKQLKHQTK